MCHMCCHVLRAASTPCRPALPVVHTRPLHRPSVCMVHGYCQTASTPPAVCLYGTRLLSNGVHSTGRLSVWYTATVKRRPLHRPSVCMVHRYCQTASTPPAVCLYGTRLLSNGVRSTGRLSVWYTATAKRRPLHRPSVCMVHRCCQTAMCIRQLK